LLTFAPIAAGIAVLVAAYALFRLRSASKRVERTAESYWELRYEIGQLKVRLNRLETGAGLVEAKPEADAADPPPASTTSFIPLSSLKK
jgi:hypothetical protein